MVQSTPLSITSNVLLQEMLPLKLLPEHVNVAPAPTYPALHDAEHVVPELLAVHAPQLLKTPLPNKSVPVYPIKWYDAYT